jgi:hypothetical protein
MSARTIAASAAPILARARARYVARTDAAGCYQSPPAATPLVLWFSRIAPELIEPGVAALAAALSE